MPTVARNIARPKLRSTMFAGSGMVQSIGPVRRSLPRISATISGPPPMPSVTVPTPGIGNRNQPEQHAEHHAEPERNITEFGGGLYRVAEMLSDFLLPVRRHQHADAVAEFQHQIRRWHEIGVVAPDMQQMSGKSGRQRKTGTAERRPRWPCRQRRGCSREQRDL